MVMPTPPRARRQDRAPRGGAIEMEEELCPRGRAKLEMLESSGGGGGDDGRVWRRPRQGQRWQGRAGGRGARARQHAEVSTRCGG